MTSLDRRRRHREELRAAIVEAALAIVSEQGLGALSIRSIADRIEYSSATIYLYFESKEALLQEVACEGFRRCEAYLEQATAGLPEGSGGLAELRALASAYVKFAIENTAYFHVMFDIPGVAQLSSPSQSDLRCDPEIRGRIWTMIMAAAERAEPFAGKPAMEARTVLLWGALHGLVSLYLSGHIQRLAADPDALLQLMRDGMTMFEQHSFA